MTQPDHQLPAFVRRLSTTGKELYIRFRREDLRRAGLRHGQPVEVEAKAGIRLRGVIRTSGGTPWLGPAKENSNAVITSTLRQIGLEHGDDIYANLYWLSGKA